MPDITAEKAMRSACDLILRGDIMGAMADLTPEAMNDAMGLAAGLTGLTLPESYMIESHQVNGDEHRFRVRFKAAERELSAWATWREIDGAWKITQISVDGIT
jgi:hypothetical protein